jgi:hypothetical protein
MLQAMLQSKSTRLHWLPGEGWLCSGHNERFPFSISLGAEGTGLGSGGGSSFAGEIDQ